MADSRAFSGHIVACLTVVLWGTTFISTKILLRTFSPVEILCIRFFIGYVALWIIRPRFLRAKSLKEELYYAGAGLSGITLYFLFENIALTYTLASNVGVIISVAPFFTALLSRIFLKTGRPGWQFYAGFAVAMAGIVCVTFNGASSLELNPTGDLLALAAAAVWAVYSTLTKKISAFGYNTIQTTRRTFFYGLVFMIPALFIFGFSPDVNAFARPENLLNVLYLGLGASALCFVTWNLAVRVLGPVKTSVYIYMVPVVTMVTSVLILREPVTLAGVAGMTLIIGGLFLSERTPRKETIHA